MLTSIPAFVGALCVCGFALGQSAEEPASRFGAEVYEIGVGVEMAKGMKRVDGEVFSTVRGTCPVEPTLQNYVGMGVVSVPGFTLDEEAAAILNAPAAHYPIEIVSIGIGWASAGGGAPDSLEGALRIYPNGLPNPGAFQFEVGGPVLVDGAINEFDITAFPGNRIINSGPFTVSLQLGNASTPGGPAPLHDNAGCQVGKSAVLVNAAQWFDNCSLGVNGQWVIHVKYKQVDCDGFVDCNGNMIDDTLEINAGFAEDCNSNGVPDECDINEGASLDMNLNGVPDECEAPCVGDLNGDLTVDSGDLAILLAAWGVCP